MDHAELQRLRQERGLSQVALAQLASISRQSLHQIETGRSVPGVDVALRLARALNCSVEQLFGERSIAFLDTQLLGSSLTPRVALAKVGERVISYPLTADQHCVPADGLLVPMAEPQGNGARVELLVPEGEIERHLVMFGCPPALGLLARHYAQSSSRGHGLWIHSSNAQALDALIGGRSHVAAVHAPLTGQDNHSAPAPDRTSPSSKAQSYAKLCFAHWHLGLISKKQRKTRILTVADLCRPGLRVANREAGARAQQLLEQQLKSAGISVNLGRVAAHQMPSHLGMANAVAQGHVDVGIASQDAALLFDLHFVPLARERIDLLFASATSDPRLERMAHVLTEHAFRRDLASLGYDTAETGRMASARKVG